MASLEDRMLYSIEIMSQLIMQHVSANFPILGVG